MKDGQELLVLSWSERLVTFDIATGAQLSTVPLPSQPFLHGGLHCWTAP